MVSYIKYIIFIPFFLYGQNSCSEFKEELDKWALNLKNSTDIISYNDYKESNIEFKKMFKLINDNCANKLNINRLKVSLLYYFSIFASLKQGDLESYSNNLETAVELDKNIKDDPNFNNNVDWFIDYRTNFRDLEDRLSELEHEYLDLRVYIKNRMQSKKNKSNKITKIIDKNSKNTVKLSITPPPDLLNHPRIKYLNKTLQNQEFILDQFDGEDYNNGFYFSIKFLPVKASEEDIEATYSITFDEKFRFHIPTFSTDDEDVNYFPITIPKQITWEYEESLPSRYIKLIIPQHKRKLGWTIYDDTGSPFTKNNISNTGLIFINNQTENNEIVDIIYIDTQKFKIINNPQIMFDERNKNWIQKFYKILSHTFILGLIIGAVS